MGRPREFEDEKALSKAIFLFWEKGYANTSLKDLLKEMNIQNGSFYNTYGTKQDLFIKAFHAYDDDFTRKRSALFDLPKTFQAKIRVLFDHVIDRQNSPCPKGCFLFNSVASEMSEDREIEKHVRKGVENFEIFLKDQIQSAKEKRELGPEIDPEITASLIVTYMQGLMKLCVLDFSQSKFQQQTEYFLTALKI